MEFCVDDGVLRDFIDEEYHTTISIPHGVKVIGEAAFADNEYLYHVVIPSTVERIERDAFLNCYSLSWGADSRQRNAYRPIRLCGLQES